MQFIFGGEYKKGLYLLFIVFNYICVMLFHRILKETI